MPKSAASASVKESAPSGGGSRLWGGVLLVLMIALALGLRLPRLGARPMHADESVHALKFVTLLEQGKYTYDPNEFHGPTLYYFTLPVVRLRGERTSAQVTEATLRLTPLLFGMGLILLLPLASGGLGRGALLGAGALLAVSPAMVYYSRYYIHELLLVVFTWVAIGAGWQYLRVRRLGWMLLAGAALGLMHATKETFVFNLAAAAAAGAGAWLWGRWRPPETIPAGGRSSRRPAKHLALGVLLAAAVSVLFFSSFFTHEKGVWQGPLDSLRAYLPWIQRAGGESPHVHPWYFYLERLGWWHRPEGPVFTELFVLALAGIGMTTGFRRRVPGGGDVRFVRFLTLYTLALTAIYSVIAYKTPWCLLGFYHGMILLAGVGGATLWRAVRSFAGRAALAGVLLAGGLHLTVEARRAAFVYAASPKNPWVYAHTSPDLLRLVRRVLGMAAHHPHPDQMVVKVMCPGGDYWPLPWYFRTLPHVGYYAAVPEDPFADAVVAGSRIAPPLDDLSNKKWIMAGYYEQRPKVFVTLYARFALWKDYIESLPPPDEGEE